MDRSVRPISIGVFRSEGGPTHSLGLVIGLFGAAIGVPSVGAFLTWLFVGVATWMPTSTILTLGEVTFTIAMSFLLAWLGFLPLLLGGFALLRSGWGGWLSFGILGAFIGAAIILIVGNDYNLGVVFAPCGTVYAFAFRWIYARTARRHR